MHKICDGKTRQSGQYSVSHPWDNVLSPADQKAQLEALASYEASMMAMATSEEEVDWITSEVWDMYLDLEVGRPLKWDGDIPSRYKKKGVTQYLHDIV